MVDGADGVSVVVRVIGGGGVTVMVEGEGVLVTVMVKSAGVGGYTVMVKSSEFDV